MVVRLCLALLCLAAVCRAQVTCTATPSVCYADMIDGKTRVLAGDFMSGGGMTHERCARICFTAGLPLGAFRCNGGSCWACVCSRVCVFACVLPVCSPMFLLAELAVVLT